MPQVVEQHDGGQDLSYLSLGSSPEGKVSTEVLIAQLRNEDRIQDAPEILCALGYSGEIPKLTRALLNECIRTNGALVLDSGISLRDYAALLNSALGDSRRELHVWIERPEGDFIRQSLGAKHRVEWKVVPMGIIESSLGMSKAEALESMPGSQTCEPRDFVLLLGYHGLAKGELLPGFIDRSTFTSERDIIVGGAKSKHTNEGIRISVCSDKLLQVPSNVGLAPRWSEEFEAE